QRAVHLTEIVFIDATHLLDRADMPVIEPGNDLRHSLALGRQLYPHRPSICIGALVVDEAEFDQLFEIVGDVGAKIVAARTEFACRQLGIADIEEQQCLRGVDVVASLPLELVLDRKSTRLNSSHVKISYAVSC